MPKYYENLVLADTLSAYANFSASCERHAAADHTVTLRVLALLEAASITGTAKAVLEMAYEARADIIGRPAVEISIANFARGNEPVDNALTRALEAAQIPFSFIREKGRFDGSVLPQIQNLAQKYEAHIIWTNSVKSHFLVHQSGIAKTRQWLAFHHGYTSTDFKMQLYNQLDYISLRHAHRVLTVCVPFAKQLQARGVPRSRIIVQHMPVRPFTVSADEQTKLRQELNLTADQTVILSIGRLSHEKGHTDLLTAFTLLTEQMPNRSLCLIFVGDGPERNKLQQQAKTINPRGQVLFVGHRDDAKRFYGIADAFALPSYTEGTPNVLLEAMSAGLPIVTTDVGGIPELAQDARQALLVPPHNPEAFAAALRKLLQSTSLQHQLTTAAQTVVAAHSPRAYFAKMRDILANLLP